MFFIDTNRENSILLSLKKEKHSEVEEPLGMKNRNSLAFPLEN